MPFHQLFYAFTVCNRILPDDIRLQDCNLQKCCLSIHFYIPFPKFDWPKGNKSKLI